MADILSGPTFPGLPAARGSAAPGPAGAPAPVAESALRDHATQFEAAFLAEMLRHAGLANVPGQFHGGAGEAAFAGTLIQEYASLIAASGRTGIAEHVFDALRQRADAQAAGDAR